MIENPSTKINIILNKLNYQKYQYLKDSYKLKKVKNNNKDTYNYFYIYKKKEWINYLNFKQFIFSFYCQIQ